MAAQLNIKDQVLIERVRELARGQGQPVTATLRGLVDKEWKARQALREEKLRRLDEIVEDVRRNMPAELRGKSSKEIMDSLYDDNEPDGFAR